MGGLLAQDLHPHLDVFDQSRSVGQEYDARALLHCPGQDLDPLFRPFALGDVFSNHGDADDPSLGVQGRCIVPGHQTALPLSRLDIGLDLTG